MSRDDGTLEAAYLNSRRPSESRIVFYHPDGPDKVDPLFPPEIAGELDDLEFQILLPCEEADLSPITPDRARS